MLQCAAGSAIAAGPLLHNKDAEHAITRAHVSTLSPMWFNPSALSYWKVVLADASVSVRTHQQQVVHNFL